jgi:hypothetical protein
MRSASWLRMSYLAPAENLPEDRGVPAWRSLPGEVPAAGIPPLGELGRVSRSSLCGLKPSAGIDAVVNAAACGTVRTSLLALTCLRR